MRLGEQEDQRNALTRILNWLKALRCLIYKHKDKKTETDSRIYVSLRYSVYDIEDVINHFMTRGKCNASSSVITRTSLSRGQSCSCWPTFYLPQQRSQVGRIFLVLEVSISSLVEVNLVSGPN